LERLALKTLSIFHVGSNELDGGAFLVLIKKLLGGIFKYKDTFIHIYYNYILYYFLILMKNAG